MPITYWPVNRSIPHISLHHVTRFEPITAAHFEQRYNNRRHEHPPAVRPLHLEHILREVNESTLAPLQLQTAAADNDTLQARRLWRQWLGHDFQRQTERTGTDSIHRLHPHPAPQQHQHYIYQSIYQSIYPGCLKWLKQYKLLLGPRSTSVTVSAGSVTGLPWLNWHQ